MLIVTARNSVFGAFGKVSIKLIGFLFTVLIVRWLGDEAYGQYALIWSYVVVISILSDAGLSLYAIREIAKKQTDSQYIVGNIIIIRVILALTSMTLITLMVWLLGYSGQFVFYVLLASNVLLLYALQEPLDGILQANERFDLSVVAIMVGLLVFIGVGAILLWMGWHITGVIAARLLNVLMSILLVWKLLANYRQDLQWRIQPALWPQFIRASLPFGLIKLWLSWSSRVDTIILAWFWPEQMVGWYGAVYALILGITVISSSINAALYPALSRQFNRDVQSLPKIYAGVLKYLLIISLPIAGVVSLTADKVIQLLYGAEFAPAGLALAIMIWVVPFAFISEFLRHVLLVVNREQEALRGLILAVLVNIGLNIWLVPYYGLLAAAGVAIITEATLTLLYLRQLRLELGSIRLMNEVFKPLLVLLVLMVVVKSLSPLPLLLEISLAGLIYLFTLWFFRVVKSDEYWPLLNSLKYNGKTRLSNFAKAKEVQSLPLVSVFIPAYNAARFVTQAIESVLAQTYPHYELIIIDDNSTDGTATLLQQYQTHPKITLYCNPTNIGMAPNWNVGLRLCHGELIAKLDADDFYEPGYLAAVVELFQKNQRVGLVFSGLNLIYPDGRSEPELVSLHSWVRNRATFLPMLLQNCLLRSPTVCVRRSCYEKLGNFIGQMHIHADWEMWTRIAANYPVGFVAQRLANYRMSYGTNCTAQAVIDGRSIADLRLWLKLLAEDKLPYRLNSKELEKFKWGIYDLEMHFASMAAYHGHYEMQLAYTVFAEEVLPHQSSPAEVENLRWVYTNFHQGIYAFREKKIKEAWHFLLQTFAAPIPIWSKVPLGFKISKRLAAGLYRRAIVKYRAD